jgi:RimJ/RimL family protein N-acetyltransferase
MWSTRASWSGDDWRLVMVVLEHGRAVGVQELSATRFAVRRTVETGSWLGLSAQGRGLGTEMRAAALHLAFKGLGAASASSGAHEDNRASHRVSEKLGYVPNGTAVVAPRGEPIRMQRYLLERQAWRPDLYPATITGLEACLPMLGLDEQHRASAR